MNTVSAQHEPTGIFQTKADIGNPKNNGSASYNAANQSYTLKVSGYIVWFERDEFHFLYNKLQGDFIMTAAIRETCRYGA